MILDVYDHYGKIVSLCLPSQNNPQINTAGVLAL